MSGKQAPVQQAGKTKIKHGRRRTSLAPNPPRARIAFVHEVDPRINIYFWDGQYVRSYRGFPEVGAGEFGELIGA